MFRNNDHIRPSKPSRKSSKRGLLTLAGTSKPDLAVDTSFNRHQGRAPQQVFPYESKTQELSFVGFAVAKETRGAKKGSLRQQIENTLSVRPSVRRTTSDAGPSIDYKNERPTVLLVKTSVPVPTVGYGPHPEPLHKRIRGLRPSPLDLTNDVSPSDRAIQIGIALPSDAVSDHMASPEEHLHRRTPAAGMQTPTIVVTPAREDFDLSYSPRELRIRANDGRASSVYSRYTNCAPRPCEYGGTPPVPPLPLSINKSASRDSARTVFEEDGNQFGGAEDAGMYLQLCSAKRLTSQSHLPTPRRSKGWWNVVTSPFSAGAKSNAPFWRWPTEHNEDHQRILDDASEMGTVDCHAGVIFTNRAPDDEGLRSALPLDTGSKRPPAPKRSDTAPGALDIGSKTVNIYRVPSRGLAAAYYNPNRHFPSLAFEDQSRGASLVGWSPSQSVAQPEKYPPLAGVARSQETFDEESQPASAASRTGLSLKEHPIGLASGERDAAQAAEVDDGPFSDRHETQSEAAHPATTRDVFMTPSEDELKSPRPARPTAAHNDTNATLESHFSPLTPTPIVENAHIATYMGPQSVNGEPREVHMTPARTLSPPEAASREAPVSDGASHTQVGIREMYNMSEKAPSRPYLHSRVSSRGLGIMDGEKVLYPPPRAFVHQPRLGTDRFGQLTIRGMDVEKAPSVPWYRRCLWALLFLIALLLMVLVVSLVMFIPQADHDMAVEAQWLNLTGFPPLPTGVATVTQPTAVSQVSGCVQPSHLWSCSPPPKDAASAGSLPDFRFEIRFRNGTLPENDTQATVVSRDSWTNSLFAANPAVPSEHDQEFLGRYTDNVSVPYSGEKTLFYMSLLDPAALADRDPKLVKRQSSPYPYPGTTNSTTNATTSAGKSIPRPALLDDGRPANPELYPFATAQPLRLFDRGLDSEHYAFYTYYDRSLYVANVSPNASTGASFSDSVVTNAQLDDAAAVCTWSQTRLHVQIWTSRGAVGSLGSLIPLKGLPAVNSTANDPAGSLAYPVTITIDRHGGRAEEKGVYCYGLDRDHKVLQNVRMWVDEERGFGGSLVNPAVVPGRNVTAVGKRDEAGSEHGGIDGGDGGCACRWQNWE